MQRQPLSVELCRMKDISTFQLNSEILRRLQDLLLKRQYYSHHYNEANSYDIETRDHFFEIIHKLEIEIKQLLFLSTQQESMAEYHQRESTDIIEETIKAYLPGFQNNDNVSGNAVYVNTKEIAEGAEKLLNDILEDIDNKEVGSTETGNSSEHLHDADLYITKIEPDNDRDGVYMHHTDGTKTRLS